MSMTRTATAGNRPVLWFGKHKGQPLDQVPSGYLLWVLDNVRLSSGVRDTVRRELESRPGVLVPPTEPERTPACRRCRCPRLHYLWHQQAGGRRQIRAECVSCGGFVYFAPQTPANVARAGAAEMMPRRGEGRRSGGRTRTELSPRRNGHGHLFPSMSL